jgi:8-oxo-dGTP pyrophosphatase MutT (NUDIX family)
MTQGAILSRHRDPQKYSVEALRRRVRCRLGPQWMQGASRSAGGDHELNPHWPDARLAGVRRRKSAVLIPLIPKQAGAWVLMTRRADHLIEHGGQIAFPGGKIGRDDTTALAAALRETGEEIGLAPEFVEVIGRLDEYRTATGFDIAPFIGILRPGFGLTPDPGEVAEVLEVPLQFLMTPANHQLHDVIWQGKTRRFHAMPYRNHYIWGATAGILRSMYERLYSE